MSVIAKLEELRRHSGKTRTQGLPDATVERMAAQFPELVEAVDEALIAQRALTAEFPDLLQLDEAAQLARVQADFVNFYADDAVNPYVALAARGPWVITLKGAVVHDS
ncbi:MAG: aminotransferase class III-fold pyridoxal phosphate-dependent enzyme, partial [Rudaea sp.]